jgi:DNA-directed RNA polymerase subunit RPC12/RpoP
MSTSFLYHGFGLRDYYYKTTRFIGGILTFEITPKPEAIKCPECDSRSVIKKGVIKRDLRTIPVGSKPVILRTLSREFGARYVNSSGKSNYPFPKRGRVINGLLNGMSWSCLNS